MQRALVRVRWHAIAEEAKLQENREGAGLERRNGPEPSPGALKNPRTPPEARTARRTLAPPLHHTSRCPLLRVALPLPLHGRERGTMAAGLPAGGAADAPAMG